MDETFFYKMLDSPTFLAFFTKHFPLSIENQISNDNILFILNRIEVFKDNFQVMGRLLQLNSAQISYFLANLKNEAYKGL